MDLPSVLAMASTCVFWRQTLQTDSVWRNLLQRFYPHCVPGRFIQNARLQLHAALAVDTAGGTASATGKEVKQTTLSLQDIGDARAKLLALFSAKTLLDFGMSFVDFCFAVVLLLVFCCLLVCCCLLVLVNCAVCADITFRAGHTFNPDVTEALADVPILRDGDKYSSRGECVCFVLLLLLLLVIC